ncbi:MAG: Rnase Y domain-containing protein, partial [Clostridia bacterium]
MISTLLFLSASEISIIVGVLSIIAGAGIGALAFKLIDKKRINGNKIKASQILEQADVEAKNAKKEAILEAKEEIQALKETADKEISARRIELQKLEDRLVQREEHIDHKESNLDKKSELLDQQKQSLQDLKANLQKEIDAQKDLREKAVKELERVAGLSSEEAKKILIDELTESARKDAYKTIKKIEEETRDKADKIAQEIVSMAIQKCATDVTSETTVSTVAIPNDEMKGR